MAKAAFVTYLIALSIIFSSGYKPECAVGPEYWCKSFQTAQDCGALRHCTDTVWRYDEKSTDTDSSTICNECQTILENTHQGIQHLANNEDLIRSSLVKGCQLFSSTDDASKCSNVLENYGTSVGSLMKHKRYTTLCRLMSVCSTKSPATEKPMIVGGNRCTWGPSYWCSSLSNSRECSSIDHCSNKIWSQQSIEKKPDDNMCKYCEYTITELRRFIEDNTTDINIEKFLSGACSMLPTKESIDECLQMMSQYESEILVLIKANIDPGVICHLSHMCKDATIQTRVTIENTQQEEKHVKIDEQSKILCNVIVRATYELHFNQKKTRNEIEDFLKNDCQKLTTTELIQKCDRLVDKHGNDIHGYVASHIELSKICDHIEDFTYQSNVQSLPNVHCELCTFVLTTAKYMLNAKQTEDTILRYIDEQICSRLTDSKKKICKQIIEFNAKDLLNEIECGTKSMLLCTRFQICIDQVLSPTSSIEKKDKNQYLKENICDKLDSFKDACHAFIDKDSTRLIQTLFNDMDGDVLCRMFGICPKKMSLIDNLSINDDTNKCKRCIDDFTRRKHIAEKLVNHSAEFLQHLCGQLPEKDACIKAVDESINELVTFIRSLNPQDICQQLKLCNKTLIEQIKPTELILPDDVTNFQFSFLKDSLNCTLCKLAIQAIKKSLTTNKTEQEIIVYIKKEICSKLGALTEMCSRTIDAEGPAIISIISKDIDPKKACTILGVCSASSSFENCNDKCECCMDKIEIHEVQIATFLRGIVESIKTLCQHMPENDQCLQMTTKFDSNINQITSQFNSKKVCQILNHCSNLPIQIETLSQCQLRIESKREFLRFAITTINQNLKSLCEYIPWNKDCYAIIDRSTLDTNDKLTELNTETICTLHQSLEDLICIKSSPFENLCKQLVIQNENNIQMEAIFKSMFNQNGYVDKELCELEPNNNCQSTISINLENCKDKCDCCVQFYTTKKTYELNTIEAYRTGLLATCDWSLSKDYCTAWFNRVCDRLKAKVDQFIPSNYCKTIGFCSTEVDQCNFNGDKCQCCKNHFNLRTNRFRNIISEITNVLVSQCTDNNCRSMVQSTQQQTLSQIDRIDSQTYCQRYGYCVVEPTSYISRLLATHIGSDIEAINERLKTAITNDICFQYGQLRPMCEDLMASSQGHRYGLVYLALLKNNSKLIDDDLREHIQTKVNTDVCDSCKKAVQSSKDYWLKTLESVRNVLLRTCERCSAKQQCQDFYNKQFDYLKTYVNNIDPDQFCQTIHLCSIKSIIIITENDKCSTCIEELQLKKEKILQGIDRLTTYFDNLCQQFSNQQCQIFIKQIQINLKDLIENFDIKQMCTSIGFCSIINNENQIDFNTYTKYLEDNIEQTICSTLGPFENLCRQILHGNRKQIQTVKINFNIKDLMKIGTTDNLFSAANINECNSDQCQCCIDRINQKTQYLKNLGDKIISIFLSACDYCPAKNQCQQLWKNYQTQFDSFINNIDSKQICTSLGFCNVSTLCSNMGVFQQACEETLTAFMKNSKVLEEHLPHTSVVVLPTKKQDEITLDSNSTCILCEYIMNILSNYIHQNSTEEEIEQSLQKICNQMPSILRNQCHDLVNNYGPAIISILINDFDVSTVCHKLNLCTKQMNVELTHITKPSLVSCSICDYVSTYIQFALKRNSSEQSLQHALKTVCTHLSQEQNPQCQILIQLFSPYIRKLELQLGNNFCKQLNICQMEKIQPKIIHLPITRTNPKQQQDEDLKKIIIQNLDDTPQCMLCHYIITYLDAVIKTNKSKEAFEAALQKVCTILPKKERAQCQEFVKTYGPVLAELISEMADPDAVCRYLGLCQAVLPKETTTSKPITYSNHDYVKLPEEQTLLTCTICQYLIGRMKHFVQENQTEEEIIISLKKSCDQFSVIKLKEQCEKFLDQYAQYIIQMISSDVQPKVACQSLGICEKPSNILETSTRRQSTPATSTMYGKCIFGMNYWCTSRQNAELCNAVELCQRQVWSKKNKNIII